MTHLSNSCMNFYFSLEKVSFLIKLQYMLHICPTSSSSTQPPPSPCCSHWAGLSLFHLPRSFPLERTLRFPLQCPNVFWSNPPPLTPFQLFPYPHQLLSPNCMFFLKPIEPTGCCQCVYGIGPLTGIWLPIRGHNRRTVDPHTEKLLHCPWSFWSLHSQTVFSIPKWSLNIYWTDFWKWL